MPTVKEILEVYDSLPEQAKAEIDSLIAEDIKAVPWKPLVNIDNPFIQTPQEQAFYSEADIMLYGGSAGGGKSSLLIGLALTAHKRTTLFRREINELSPIIEEIHRLRGTRQGYNGQLKRFDLGENRNIRLGGMQYEGDKQQYKGDARDLMGFDELSDFLESQFRFVTTWNRSTDPSQRCRVVCTSNPPTTPEGHWIIEYWAPWLDKEHPNPAMPGELRYFISDEDGKDKEVDGPDPVDINGIMTIPRSRTFIPSSIDDNPFLAESGYKANLQALPEPLRSQMLQGSFTAGHDDDPWQVIPTEWVDIAMARWTERRPSNIKMSTLGVDPARGTDKTVIAKRYGWWFDELVSMPGKDTPDGPAGAALCSQHVRDGATIMIDIIGGAGSSIYDHLRSNGMNVEGVNGTNTSHGHDKSGTLNFFNARAENWWRMREALDPEDGDKLALPPDRELKADLCAPRWKLSSRGIQVESKVGGSDGFGDLRKRLGRSPDKGDAVVYALREGKNALGPNRPKPSRANSRYSVTKRGRRR